jgi:hypothetical protein
LLSICARKLSQLGRKPYVMIRIKQTLDLLLGELAGDFRNIGDDRGKSAVLRARLLYSCLDRVISGCSPSMCPLWV